MAHKRKYDDAVRQRIREMNAAGLSDSQIARQIEGVAISMQSVRNIRMAMKLPLRFAQPTVFGDVCPACGVTLGKYRPLCRSCWESIPRSRRFAIGTNLRWRKREDVERLAKSMVAEVKR